MILYRLRTLLIVLALGLPVLAGAWLAWRQQSAATGRASLLPIKCHILGVSDLGVPEGFQCQETVVF
jgi:hypothetical protein